MFTIDASVHINALDLSETGSAESQMFLAYAHRGEAAVYSPTLLIVEVCATVARVFDDPDRGLAMMNAIRGLPGQIWVPLDEIIAQVAGQLGATYRLRGADSIYAAVAKCYNATLVTLDRQQLERLAPAIAVKRPVDLLP